MTSAARPTGGPELPTSLLGRITADWTGVNRWSPRASDEGFTLVEVLVSMTVVMIVLGSTTAFLVSGMRSTHRQGRQQAAVHLALDGMELARTLRGRALVAGRQACTTAAGTCDTTVAAAADLLGADATARYDRANGAATTLPLASSTAPADRALTSVTVDGVAFRRYFYVGRCWAPAGGGACRGSGGSGRIVPLYRVVVAVTWGDAGCGGTCSYVSSGLFTGNPLDPTFSSA
jgi:type II secretory pathway pseudopilin PulG